MNWVGIDGYYLRPSWKFAALFGPTIKAVRALTLDPILISETGAAQAAGKAAKIANLFAGVRAYGLLGLVWFDADKHRDWRVAGPAAVAAFRRGRARPWRRCAHDGAGAAMTPLRPPVQPRDAGRAADAGAGRAPRSTPTSSGTCPT